MLDVLDLHLVRICHRSLAALGIIGTSLADRSALDPIIRRAELQLDWDYIQIWAVVAAQKNTN
jgi:hypothetical protein